LCFTSEQSPRTVPFQPCSSASLRTEYIASMQFVLVSSTEPQAADPLRACHPYVGICVYLQQLCYAMECEGIECSLTESQCGPDAAAWLLSTCVYCQTHEWNSSPAALEHQQICLVCNML
jgi:hypothetical protein